MRYQPVVQCQPVLIAVRQHSIRAIFGDKSWLSFYLAYWIVGDIGAFNFAANLHSYNISTVWYLDRHSMQRFFTWGSLYNNNVLNHQKLLLADVQIGSVLVFAIECSIITVIKGMNSMQDRICMHTVYLVKRIYERYEQKIAKIGR